MSDELAKAAMSTIIPALKAHGFRRHGKRDLVRIDGSIAQRIYFQLSAWGSRDFCITCSANLIPSNEVVTLQPGFRLGKGGWLPSKTAHQATQSTREALIWILSEGMPFFESVRSLDGFSAHLAKETWGSLHHLKYQQGVAFVLQGKFTEAQTLLQQAQALYRLDGSAWCGYYIANVSSLLEALDNGTAPELLDHWHAQNAKLHGG